MEPETEREGCPRIVVIDGNADQIQQLESQAPDFEWIEVEDLTGLRDKRAAAIIVFSKKYEEDRTLSTCHKIREDRSLDRIPLLAAVSMYEMPLGNDVKRLPNADFIFRPTEKGELHAKLRDIGSESDLT